MKKGVRSAWEAPGSIPVDGGSRTWTLCAQGLERTLRDLFQAGASMEPLIQTSFGPCCPWIDVLGCVLSASDVAAPRQSPRLAMIYTSAALSGLVQTASTLEVCTGAARHPHPSALPSGGRAFIPFDNPAPHRFRRQCEAHLVRLLQLAWFTYTKPGS